MNRSLLPPTFNMTLRVDDLRYSVETWSYYAATRDQHGDKVWYMQFVASTPDIETGKELFERMLRSQHTHLELGYDDGTTTLCLARPCPPHNSLDFSVNRSFVRHTPDDPCTVSFQSVSIFGLWECSVDLDTHPPR